jgi:hypothetical protein
MTPATDGAPSPTQLATGMTVDIANVGGTTEANGEGQLITVVNSTTIDLPNVGFVHAYTSGGVIAGPLDAMVPSLDTFPLYGTPAIAAFTSAGALGFFNGPHLEATIESTEKGDMGPRLWCQGFRPITDAITVKGSLGYRENLQATRVYGSENSVNAQGFVPQRRSARYMRGKIRIPYGSIWTYATGIEPETTTDGDR